MVKARVITLIKHGTPTTQLTDQNLKQIRVADMKRGKPECEPVKIGFSL